MKEETRIEALEHELKILKNEIQSTLLEIREHILNHYYPELRAEEPARPVSLPKTPPAARAGATSPNGQRVEKAPPAFADVEVKGQIQPFSDIFLEDLESDEPEPEGHILVNSRRPMLDPDDAYEADTYEDGDDDEDDIGDALNKAMGSMGEAAKMRKATTAPRETLPATPQTREVNFRQLKQATQAPKAASLPSEKQTAKAQRTNFSALVMWVNEGITKVGKERTLQVVETYATGGKLPSDIQSSLLQMISLASDEEPTSPIGNQEMLALLIGLDQIIG